MNTEERIKKQEATNAHLRDRVRVLEALRGWMPIETAPKDGTRVLLSIREDGLTIGYYCGGAWIYQESSWHNPTHWHPLPEPPEGGTP